MKALKGIAVGFLEIFRSENLGLDEAPSRDDGSPSFLAWLMKPEELPRPAVSVPPRKTSFLNWLLVPEKLPPPPGEEAPGRPSFLAVLTSREDLPKDPEPGKPPEKIK